jgi:hypothetical protein
VNEPHIEPPREREQSLLPANSIGGDASLSTNPILHGRQEVDNQTQDPNDELQDTGTSPTAPGDTMASEERPMHDNDVPPTNPVFPLATNSLFKVLMVEVPHIACCFQAGLMGLTRKEMHLFQPWKTLTRSMQLLSAYKRLPPIRCLHPNHGSCSNHRQVCLEDRCVSSLPCIQHSLLQILPHVFEPPILQKVKMISSLLTCSLSKRIMPRWHQKWPCRRAISLLKCPILLLLNKVAPPVTCN